MPPTTIRRLTLLYRFLPTTTVRSCACRTLTTVAPMASSPEQQQPQTKPVEGLLAVDEPQTKPVEGLLAVNKPRGPSSATVVRRVQDVFKKSALFADTLAAETARRNRESTSQKRRRSGDKARHIDVKIGHGGTLDPMASGVLILGIGRGTKGLGRFLNCTKSYETTAIFGAATDTYDSEGRVVRWAPWAGIDRETVEAALGQFRGDIMQKPPMFVSIFFFFFFSSLFPSFLPSFSSYS